MAELTPNLGLAKPTINGEETENTWGYDLNANFDILDEAVVQSRVSDGDKGDIIVSAQGELWAFDPTVVTPAGRGVIAVDAQSGLLEQNGATAFKKRGITVHNSPPVGGIDGDLWLQYNLALPPEVNWDVSSAYFNTFTEAMASDIPNTVLAIRTSGRLQPGDGGGWEYRRLNAAPANPARSFNGRSIDRNKLDGGSDPVLGGYWQLAPNGAPIPFACFGGKNDSDINGVIGTANDAALDDAVNFIAWEINPFAQYAWPVQFGLGHYRFANTVERRTMCALIGAYTGGPTNNGTNFHWPANVIPMIFHSWNTVGQWGVAVGAEIRGEATGSIMANISIYGKQTSTDHSLAGIVVRCKVSFYNIGFFKIAGNALEAKAGSGWLGGVNGSHFDNIYVHSCSRDGIWINGGDANVCTFNHIDLHGPSYNDGAAITGGIGGCGIFDASNYGNTYTNVHIAGYGNHGVQYDGRRFFLIGYAGDAGTVPGTNNKVWYDIGPLAAPNSQFPAWSATPAIPHRQQIPIFASGTSTFENVYVEAQSAPCHAPGGAISKGGIAWWSRYSTGMNAGTGGGIFSSQGMGGSQIWYEGEAGNVWNGTGTFASVGQAQPSDPERGLAVWAHGRRNANEGDNNWTYRYFDRDLRYSYFNPADDQYWVWNITTPSTDRTFGRSTSQAFVFNPDKLALGRGADARLLGWWTDPAVTPAGDHAVNEIILAGRSADGFFSNTLGWRCSVAGNPGTLDEIRGICLPLRTGPEIGGTLAPGAVSIIYSETIAGAVKGDAVDATSTEDLGGLILNAWVSAANTVKYQLFNPTAASIGPFFMFIKLRVRK